MYFFYKKRQRSISVNLIFILIFSNFLMFGSLVHQVQAATIDLDSAKKFSVADSNNNEWVFGTVGLEGDKTGVLKVKLDSNWEILDEITYKVYRTDGSEVFTTDVKALMGARASNVSDFSVYPLSGGRSIITWEGTNNGCSGSFQFIMLDLRGNVIKEATNISTQASTYNCYTGATELTNGNIAFFWQHAGNEYYLRIFDSNGNPVTEPTSITNTGTRELPAGSTYEHSIAASSDGTFMITYHSYDSGYYQGVIYNNNGTQRTVNGFNHFKLSDLPKPSGGAYSKVVGLTNGKYAVYYRTHAEGKVKFFNSSGEAIGNEIDTDLVWNFISLATGGFLVAETPEIRAKHYDNDGTLLENWKSIDNDQGDGWSELFFAGYDQGFGVYNSMTGNIILHGMGEVTVPPIENSMISPTSVTFDQNEANQLDVEVTMTLNGNTLSSILNGTTLLQAGTDYEVSGNTVTIKKEYLAKQVVGTTTLTFTFSSGDPQNLEIEISDTTPSSGGCADSIPPDYRCEDFESVDPTGSDYSPRTIGDWTVAILQENGAHDPNAVIGIFNENDNQMLDLMNEHDVGEYALFKLTSGDSFKLVSFKAKEMGQALYTVLGYKSGVPVPGAEYDFNASTLTTVELTNPAWGNITEFRIVQQKREKDISLLIDDLVVTDADAGGEPVLPELEGTVSITGEAKFGSTFMADISRITYRPNATTDNPTYQWYRGATSISEATSPTYTLVEADIGETIKVTVTADGTNAVGSVTSAETAVVEKADGPSAPSAPTEVSKTTTTIMLQEEAGQEYSGDNGTTWQDSPIFSGLMSDTEYTFITRVKETATHKASPDSEGTTIRTEAIPVIGGTVSIIGDTKYGSELTTDLSDITYTPTTTEDVPTYQWYRGATSISEATSPTYTLVEADIGETIKVTVTADGTNAVGSVTSVETAVVEKADGPSAPSAPTEVSKTTTTIMLQEEAGQEYSGDNGTTWQDSPIFSGLMSDTEYTFITRVKETATHKASPDSEGTTIKTSKVATYTITYNGNNNTGGTVPTDGGTYEEGDDVTVLGNTGNLVRAGYTFAGWNTQADGNGTNYEAGAAFSIGIKNVTLYAKWIAIPPSGGGGGGGSTPPRTPTPNQPGTEIITVPVETGNVGSGSTVTQTQITRTTDPNGRVNDEVVLTPERAKETVQSVTEAGQTLARIVIPDEKDAVSQVNVTILQEAAKELGDSRIDLEIYTENVRIIVPQQSLDGFENDLFFHVVPLKDEAERREVENRARVEQIVREMGKDQTVNVIARPMTIETNMQSSPVTLVLPLRDVELPTNQQEREAFLADLVVFIEHSDGERELVKANLVEYKGNQIGLEFNVHKFSTFAILYIEGWDDDYLFHQAYIKGFTDGTFKPQNMVTRAEVAAMLARNLEYDHARPVNHAPFPDVQSTHWASGAIEFVKQEGLMRGDTTGTFHPNASMTRAEMAVIAGRYMELGEGDLTNPHFLDVSSHWAADSIEAASLAGIVNGYTDGTYKPNGHVTRAEAVTMINRLFNRGPLYGITIQSYPDVPATHWAFYDIEEAAQDHVYTIHPEAGENIVN
ncbi:S-layer homology domain-containing protein [Alkalihalobacillus oceani]|uniref:S-layer homology domain-containing protein n=1 Tax=Halalkalibacter oceani TaxID=1653776 RepID=A0A9X2IRP5_9BACI|nr:S-layer homology domain-containing protein [Halalkalibacter oceani]MCM3716662.1 S-layer homology domain-containing protein [Halalkalibacter oceani]